MPNRIFGTHRAKTKTIIFAGYGLGDANLRILFEEIRKDGDNHPRHYIVRPGIKAVEANYWQERRVRTIDASFEALLIALDKAIQVDVRKLALLPAAFAGTSFTRFISRAGTAESAPLIRYLESQCEHVSERTVGGGGSPKQFYRGFGLGWYPISANLDVPRRLAQVVLDERIIPVQSLNGPVLSVVKAHAGGGKSVLLRRLAWDTAKKYQRLVFRIETPSALNREMFEEIVSLTNQPIFVFIDDVTEAVGEIASFYRYAKQQRWPLVIIGGARFNEWNMRCEDLEPLVEEEYELKYLTEREIDGLLSVLAEHSCLGHLASLSIDERRAKLKEVYGRQLLVALHEATENATFANIIADEYAGIFPPEAKLLYLDICSLHRFGPPVRAGLIARVHGIDFDDFQKKFFKPLEQVVEITRDPKSQDWVYRARHAVIADIVYREALPSIQEKYDNLMRIISKLNPSYSYDREVLYSLVKATSLVDIFKDRALGEAIYQKAKEAFGETSMILQQWGIYEMRLADDAATLDRANSYFEKALELSPSNPAIRHSLAELSLKRAGKAQDDIEREAWRRRSEVQSRDLARGSRNSYPQHTLTKIAIYRVKDALERNEADDNDLTQEALSQAIKEAEDVLREGLQRFPNDDRLLNEEATLSEVLQNADRALSALERAFKSNPRSELIARRLARVLRAKQRLDDAIVVLRQTLELNPGSLVLHYDLAQALMASSPDADIGQGDAILYHLQRSFSKGDRNHEARFWYARQLCLMGRGAEAQPIFGSLKLLTIPLKQKRSVRGVVRSQDGSPAVFYGQLYAKKPFFGFIRGDQTGLEIFASAEQIVGGIDALSVGTRVRFELGFSLVSPVALNVGAY